jgi:hypothetical protein
MNVSETMRAKRYRVLRQSCKELKAKLKEETNPEIIASTKRMLYTFQKAIAFVEAEIQIETGFETL